MADTKRTTAELLTIFADGQSANEITEQDFRDFVVSMIPLRGIAYMTGNGTETNISSTDVYQVITGVFSAQKEVEMTIGANGLITYTGAVARNFDLNSTIVFEAENDNKTFVFQWHKNGTPIGNLFSTKHEKNDMNRLISCYANIDLVSTDTVQLMVKNSFDTTDLIVREAVCNVISVL